MHSEKPVGKDSSCEAALALLAAGSFQEGCGSSGTKAKMFRERAEGGASGWRMGEEPGECWEVDLRRAWCD